MPTITGVVLSPFVRKIHAFCYEKGIAFDAVPLIPTNVPDEFKAKSPLGKIPLWEDENGPLPDSSCIALYLEKLHPSPALYPNAPADYGRALFLEEYADTKLNEVTSSLFFQIIVAPNFLNQPPDQARIKQVEEELQPPVFDYLEKQLHGASPAVGDALSIADLALGTCFISLLFAGKQVDASRWPKTAAYARWMMERPSFQRTIADGKAMMGGT